MKIGILCYPTFGGSGVVATQLGKELAMRGHTVHFISYSIPMKLTSFSDNIMFHKVEMASYPLFDFPLYSLALASKIVEVAKFSGLDLVHAHYAIPHATSAFLAREIMTEDHLSGKNNSSKIKIITTLHGTDITLVGLEISFLPTMKFSIEKSDGVTAVSSFLKIKTISQYNIKKDIEVIPNFINPDEFKRISNHETDCLKQRYSPNGEKIIVHTSNFRPLKRVTDCIRVFNEVRKKIPSKLLLIGDGPDRSTCEYLAKDLGIYNDVTFYGNQESFIEILSIADLFLLPSQSESFGLSALEAMACSVPVVSSNAGGLPELNLHGETGYIAEMGDITKMAEYSLELLENKNKYNIFSKNARERAVELFSVDKIIPQYESYYDKILGS